MQVMLMLSTGDRKKDQKALPLCFSGSSAFWYFPLPTLRHFPHRKTFCETTPEEKFDPIWPSKKSSTWGASPFALNFWRFPTQSQPTPLSLHQKELTQTHQITPKLMRVRRTSRIQEPSSRPPVSRQCPGP